jgi:hypothetical protein
MITTGAHLQMAASVRATRRTGSFEAVRGPTLPRVVGRRIGAGVLPISGASPTVSVSLFPPQDSNSPLPSYPFALCD